MEPPSGFFSSLYYLSFPISFPPLTLTSPFNAHKVFLSTPFFSCRRNSGSAVKRTVLFWGRLLPPFFPPSLMEKAIPPPPGSHLSFPPFKSGLFMVPWDRLEVGCAFPSPLTTPFFSPEEWIDLLWFFAPFIIFFLFRVSTTPPLPHGCEKA